MGRVDTNIKLAGQNVTFGDLVIDISGKKEGRKQWCIPFRYGADDSGAVTKKNVEVLMINSQTGPGLLFPKGGWENDETVEEAAAREALEEAGIRGDILGYLGEYDFKSKTHQDEFSPDGSCKASVFALLVKEELPSWPEMNTRRRRWLTIPEAIQKCRHPWMQKALEEGFSQWHVKQLLTSSSRDKMSRAD